MPKTGNKTKKQAETTAPQTKSAISLGKKEVKKAADKLKSMGKPIKEVIGNLAPAVAPKALKPKVKKHSADSIYEKVRIILRADRNARNSDKTLICLFWEEQIEGEDMFDITLWDVMQDSSLTPAETITRARRQVQKDYKSLRPTNKEVIKARRLKEATKGKFIF